MANEQSAVTAAINQAFDKRGIRSPERLINLYGVESHRWKELALGAAPKPTEIAPIAEMIGRDLGTVRSLISGPSAPQPDYGAWGTPGADNAGKAYYEQSLAAARARLQDTPGYHSRAVQQARARLLGRGRG